MQISKLKRTAVLLGALSALPAAAQAPVKVFVLAGQSNMQGHGRIEDGNGGVVGAIGSLRYQVNNDPANYGHLGDGAGSWNTVPDTYIYTTDGQTPGGLTAGYGVNSTKIGPELGFGWAIDSAYGGDVLIIKTTWGGKSLVSDFRSPSAALKRGGEVGFYYKEILNTVDNVLSDIGTYVPGYAGQGYEMKGFGWHQGWNDRINTDAVNEYEENFVDFINDIRFDLRASDLPFVVANTGIGGPTLSGNALNLANAQLGVANLTLAPNQIDVDPEPMYPQHVGNVKGVNTTDYWRDESVSPVNQGFHWNQNGETMYLMGDAMGNQMATMTGYSQFERAYLTVDLQSGEIKIVNPGTNIADMDLEAYTITSASGALSAADWASIAANYDGDGDGSVDSGNWSIATASTGELSETADLGGTDGLVVIGNEISLGTGAWIQNLTKDIVATYTDTNGEVINLNIRYLGFDNILADLTTDGLIDVNDWAQFLSGAQVDLSGLSDAQAYQAGDLDGDGDNDIDDFDIFRRQFELLNPAPGAFAAMVAAYAVPEPSSMVLLGLGLAGLAMRRRRADRVQCDSKGCA